MATYKIKNITNELGIRDANYNKILDIEYLDNFTRKTYQLKPNQIMFLETRTLELSVEKLRARGYIIIDQVNSKQRKRTIRIEGGKSVVENIEKNEKLITKQVTRKTKSKEKLIDEMNENYTSGDKKE